MAAFGTFAHTSELCALNFPVGSSVPVTPAVSTVPMLQALLSPSTFYCSHLPIPWLCHLRASCPPDTLLFDSKISSLLLSVTQCLDFFLPQVPGVLLMTGTDLPWTCWLAEV